MKNQILCLLLPLLLYPITGISQNNDCVDGDGNVYKTVKIGNQVWMVENLKTTRYQDGSPIRYQQPWDDNNYKDEARYIELKDGSMLYNYFAVSNPKKIAPKGWRIPTENDIKELLNYLVKYNDDLPYKELVKKRKILAKILKSTTGWDKVKSGGHFPYPCPNCYKWPEFKKKNDFCKVCENDRWLTRYIPIEWHDNNGINSVNFNVKQISTIQSDYYYSDLEFSDYPAFWTSTSPGYNSYQKSDDRYSIIYQFLGDEFYFPKSMRKKALLQVRCVKNSYEELQTIKPSSVRETIKPSSVVETIKPYNSMDRSSLKRNKFENLPPIKNTCNDFPYKLGCVSDKIRDIQICLNPTAALKEDGHFGRLMLKAMRDKSLFSGSYDESTITKELYDGIMSSCK